MIDVSQSKASVYDDLLDTLKLLEEDPEPLRQSEKVKYNNIMYSYLISHVPVN